MNEQIIPPQYTPDQWEATLHKDRITALHNYSKNFIHTTQNLKAIKDEIIYYQDIQNQINEMIR